MFSIIFLLLFSSSPCQWAPWKPDNELRGGRLALDLGVWWQASVGSRGVALWYWCRRIRASLAPSMMGGGRRRRYRLLPIPKRMGLARFRLAPSLSPRAPLILVTSSRQEDEEPLTWITDCSKAFQVRSIKAAMDARWPSPFHDGDWGGSLRWSSPVSLLAADPSMGRKKINVTTIVRFQFYKISVSHNQYRE